MKKKTKKKIIAIVIILIVYLFNTYVNISDGESPIKKRTTDVINETESKLMVTFLDVGQADSILIENNGKYMLIDAGNNEDGPCLVNYFKRLGIKEFEYVIGTHAHEDHIGGMDDIIKNFSVKTFYMPEVITTTKTFEDLLDALEEKQLAFESPEIDQTFLFEDASVTTLYINNNSKNLNDSSIVLKLNHKNISFLFTGDSSTTVEKEILNKNIESDVLKVGHHGSKYSTSTNFLNKVNPKYAIISVGINNIYNHPSDEIIKRLENKNIKVYRTDQDKSVLAESNGSTITFELIETNTNG